MDREFEEYFLKRLEEDREMIEKLSYSLEEIRNIYRQEYDWKKNIPALHMKLEQQPLDYDTVDYYLPEKWEMPREGKLLYSDEDVLNVLKLIIFNLGVKKALDSIPRDLLEQYIKSE